jgi:hypothetical protein
MHHLEYTPFGVARDALTFPVQNYVIVEQETSSVCQADYDTQPVVMSTIQPHQNDVLMGRGGTTGDCCGLRTCVRAHAVHT